MDKRINMKIYTSKDIELLKVKLANNIKESKEIFIPEFIVTQDYGVKNWLRNKLTEDLKIAANLRFVNKEDF